MDKHKAVCAQWDIIQTYQGFAGVCYIMVNPEDSALGNISLPQEDRHCMMTVI